MNLAAGYIAQTLRAHDEHLAGRVNEQRRMAAEGTEHPTLRHRIAGLVLHRSHHSASALAAH
ncbi:hypothetical protein BCL57_001561 [Agromyces flavus]|uniref:Uncharacterized protein n=1 Tax=Agromyces flavus TaxID=589382 RepID=A0A1H2A3C0_9MICO|nr:hypothetical protein [Agromyces flavus]MCP2367407.1 hypothetical protein [Agromyces flavus]GGI45786.1 hypothetical protein GCM10010932_11330 [Agromyces flavus]SDT40383.1 hypothetical protein SAMN04489721_3485 [Agromyces flavus]